MPYVRRRTRRTPRRSIRARRRRPTIRRRVTRLARTVRAIMPEIKRAEAYYSSQTIDWDGYVQDVTAAITSGTLALQKIGDQVTLKTFTVKGTFTLMNDANDLSYRVMCFTFKQNPGYVGTPANILLSYLDAGAIGTERAPQALRDWSAKYQFITHYDRQFQITSNAAIYDAVGTSVESLDKKQVFNMQIKIPLKCARVKYVTSSVTTTETNTLFFAVISSSASANALELDGSFRLTFTDS